jgi:hypothetical protein
MKRHILRFEIKFLKMGTFSKQRIKAFSDLTKPASFEFIGRLLLQRLEEILITGLSEIFHKSFNRQ